MINRRGISVVATLVAVMLTTVLAADSTDSLPPKKPLNSAPTKKTPPPSVLRELLEIREQQGSVIRGTLLEPKRQGEVSKDTASFLEALGEVAGEVTDRTAPRKMAGPSLLSEQDLVTRSADPLVASMLDVCRQMEQRANQWETTQGRDRDADRLRRLVRRLRREARGMEP